MNWKWDEVVYILKALPQSHTTFSGPTPPKPTQTAWTTGTTGSQVRNAQAYVGHLSFKAAQQSIINQACPFPVQWFKMRCSLWCGQLHIFSSVDDYMRRLRRCGLARENMSLTLGFEISRLVPFRVCSLCFLFVVQDVCQPATTAPHCYGGDDELILLKLSTK